MIKKLQALKKRKGFTLVELIVVIAIIGVLAAILVPTMLGYVTSSRVQSANSTATEIKNSINNWITDMDTKGYSMAKTSGTPQDTWTITFTNGACNAITRTNTTGVWSAAGAALTGPTGAANTGAGNGVYGYLEEVLESDYTFNNVAITAYINEGKCIAVVYYADGDSMVADAPSYANFTGTAYTWSGTDGITSTTGAVLGTSPQLTTSLS